MWHFQFVICKALLERNNFYIFLAISDNSLLLIFKQNQESEVIPFPSMGEINFRSEKISTPLHPKFTFITSSKLEYCILQIIRNSLIKPTSDAVLT